MNKKIKKYIYNIKKYSWIIMLIYIYLFTSLISSISEKTLEFRNVSINAEKTEITNKAKTTVIAIVIIIIIVVVIVTINLQMILIKIRKKRRIRKKNKKI